MTLPHATLGSRALFPMLKARAYLNHGGISPLSAPVLAAMNALASSYAERGSEAFGAAMASRAQLRVLLSRLLPGSSPEDLALRPNTTQGVIDIAWSRPWRAGERVVLFHGEFPANVTPWQQAAAHFGLTLDWHESELFRTQPDAALAALERTLREGVALVAVSAVQFQTGLRMPLEAIGALCRAHGAELFVDAVQALGMVPLDLRLVQPDYLCAGGHKWLLSPEGTGLLYVSPARAKSLVPRLAGWLSHAEPVRFLLEGAGHLRYDRPLRQCIDFLEGGNVNATGLAGLGASVELLLQLGIENVFAHVQRYHDALEPGLLALGFESARTRFPGGRSGSLSVKPPGSATLAQWCKALSERGVVCSTPDGWLRFSPHWPNALDEVPGVLEAVREAHRELAR